MLDLYTIEDVEWICNDRGFPLAETDVETIHRDFNDLVNSGRRPFGAFSEVWQRVALARLGKRLTSVAQSKAY